MSENGEEDATALAELRARIDAVDEEMHRLLIERGSVIDQLIRLKGTSLPGAAFRPAREAAMMRRLAARHHGALPLATVEHIWREIITTFTAMQAPFSLVLDGSVEPDRMRDVARFYFGFSVDLITLESAEAVVARLARGKTDLGLVAAERPAGSGPWWRGLGWPERPRIMALLPFIRAAGRPADLPAFVISPPLTDPTPMEFRIVAARLVAGAPSRIGDLGGAVLAVAEVAATTELLLALPAGIDDAVLVRRAADLSLTLDGIATVGSVARGIDVPASGAATDPLYSSVDHEEVR